MISSRRDELSINVTVNGARGNAEIKQMVYEGVAAGIAQSERWRARQQELAS
jgi:hypothetical protein